MQICSAKNFAASSTFPARRTHARMPSRCVFAHVPAMPCTCAQVLPASAVCIEPCTCLVSDFSLLQAGDDSKCRSSNGQGGYDCWAGCHGDPYACAAGYVASVSGIEVIEVAGQACWKYTCLLAATGKTSRRHQMRSRMSVFDVKSQVALRCEPGYIQLGDASMTSWTYVRAMQCRA